MNTIMWRHIDVQLGLVDCLVPAGGDGRECCRGHGAGGGRADDEGGRGLSAERRERRALARTAGISR